MRQFVTIFFTLFLVACASSTPPLAPLPRPTLTPTLQPPNHPTTQPTVLPTAIPTITPTPPPALVALRLWHAQPYTHHATLATLVAQFNAAHPSIRVIEAYQGDPAALAKQSREALDAGAPPDLLLAYPDDLAQLIQRNALAPLADLPAHDLFPAFLDRYSQFGDQAYSIAPARALHVMYYNADLLRLVGAARPPETWDELTRLCDALAKIPATTCFALTPSAATLTTWVWNRGGDVASADGTTILFAQKPGADALDSLGDLFKKKQAPLLNKAFQAPTDFALGKIAFTFDTTSGLGAYDRAIKNASQPFAWGIAPSPRTTREPVILAFGPALAIVKTDIAHERAARVFVDWMLDRAANSAWAKATGMLPARASTQTGLTEYARANTQYGVALGWLKYARAEPNWVTWSAMRVHLAEAMLAVANGKAATDALNEAAKKSRDALTGR